MAKRYYAAHVKCPYYDGNTGRSIRCRIDEGDKMYINPTFQSRADFADYKATHCKHHTEHKRCPIYKMLEDIENGNT